MIENRLLEILVVFEECGTLSKTAEQLQISQPALSRSMQKLEEEIHVPLFSRTKNSLSLNENGKFFAKEAKKVLKANEAMVEKVQAFDITHRSIHIGYSAPGPKLKYEQSFQKEFPDSEIVWTMNKDEDQLMDELLDGKYNCIIIQDQKIDPSLYKKQCLLEELYVSVLPANPISSYTDGIHFSDVNGQTFLQNTVIGIWDHVVETYLPDSRIIKQDRSEDLVTLVNSSPFPAFLTNVTDPAKTRHINRISIPILDEEAKIQFVFVMQKKDIPHFEKIFPYFNED